MIDTRPNAFEIFRAFPGNTRGPLDRILVSNLPRSDSTPRPVASAQLLLAESHQELQWRC